MIKNIKLGVTEYKEITFDIESLPKKWRDFVIAWCTDEEERTEEQEALADEYDFIDMLVSLGYNVVEVEVEDYED